MNIEKNELITSLVNGDSVRLGVTLSSNKPGHLSHLSGGVWISFKYDSTKKLEVLVESFHNELLDRVVIKKKKLKL